MATLFPDDCAEYKVRVTIGKGEQARLSTGLQSLWYSRLCNRRPVLDGSNGMPSATGA